jgi:hypothetical protein
MMSLSLAKLTSITLVVATVLVVSASLEAFLPSQPETAITYSDS